MKSDRLFMCSAIPVTPPPPVVAIKVGSIVKFEGFLYIKYKR